MLKSKNCSDCDISISLSRIHGKGHMLESYISHRDKVLYNYHSFLYVLLSQNHFRYPICQLVRMQNEHFTFGAGSGSPSPIFFRHSLFKHSVSLILPYNFDSMIVNCRANSVTSISRNLSFFMLLGIIGGGVD
jgi:hypothetical protein